MAKTSGASAARQVVADALAGSGDHLGDMVWMSLSVDVARGDVRSAFLREGLPAQMAPEDPTEERAFGMAVSAFGQRDENGLFVKRVDANAKGGDVLVCAVNAQKEVDTFGRVGLDGNGNLGHVPARLWDYRADSVLDKLRATYAERMTRCAGSELSASVVEVLTRWCGGIRMRERGNLYWVHREGAGEVRALARAVEALGRSYVSVLPVHDHPEARVSVQRAATETFVDELRAIDRELEQFKVANVRATTLERRLDQYQELRERVDMYADVLGNKRDELLTGLENAKQVLRELLAGAESDQ